MTNHRAFSWLDTRVLYLARRDAMVVVAGLVTGTVSVRATINLSAGDEGVALQSRWTGTGGLVVGRGAHSLSSTWCIARATDRATLLVATCMAVQTVIIHSALHFETGNVRVTLVALLTGAHGVVVDDATEGMVSTGTGVFADLVDAGVSLPAVIISLAS